MEDEMIDRLTHDEVDDPRFLEAFSAYEALEEKAVGPEADDAIAELADCAHEALFVRFSHNPVGIMALLKEIGACRLFALFRSGVEAVLIDELSPSSDLILGFNLAHLIGCAACQRSLRGVYRFNKQMLDFFDAKQDAAK